MNHTIKVDPDGNDYVLETGASVWIQCGSRLLYIWSSDAALSVEAFDNEKLQENALVEPVQSLTLGGTL